MYGLPGGAISTQATATGTAGVAAGVAAEGTTGDADSSGLWKGVARGVEIGVAAEVLDGVAGEGEDCGVSPGEDTIGEGEGRMVVFGFGGEATGSGGGDSFGDGGTGAENGGGGGEAFGDGGGGEDCGLGGGGGEAAGAGGGNDGGLGGGGEDTGGGGEDTGDGGEETGDGDGGGGEETGDGDGDGGGGEETGDGGGIGEPGDGGGSGETGDVDGEAGKDWGLVFAGETEEAGGEVAALGVKEDCGLAWGVEGTVGWEGDTSGGVPTAGLVAGLKELLTAGFEGEIVLVGLPGDLLTSGVVVMGFADRLPVTTPGDEAETGLPTRDGLAMGSVGDAGVTATGDGETVGAAGVMLPILVVAGVLVGVDTGATRGEAGTGAEAGDAGISILNGGAKPGHLPQVICMGIHA